MSSVARTARTHVSPTIHALWANSVMESWRAAGWEIGSVFMWLRVDRTAVCSPLRRCPRESCLQNRALRYTRYSEGHFVDRTRDPTKISMCRGFDPIEPIVPPDPRNGPF